jgi:hypothetical protein
MRPAIDGTSTEENSRHKAWQSEFSRYVVAAFNCLRLRQTVTGLQMEKRYEE